MSDTYYRERAARRARLWGIVGGLVVLTILVALGVRSLYYDPCTRGFDRAPEAVASAYVAALTRGDAAGAQSCWQHQAYYDLAAGCSEMCLSRLGKAGFVVESVAPGSVTVTDAGRARLTVAVSVLCEESGARASGELVLDSIRANVPWKHWMIVSSTVGGTVAQAWCD